MRAKEVQAAIGCASVILIQIILVCKWNDLMVGAGREFMLHWFVLYATVWLSVWLAARFATRCESYNELICRDVAAIILVWPLLGVATCAAEVWTLSSRIGTADSTGRVDCELYANMSGMGQALGWKSLIERIISFSLAGILTAPAWILSYLVSLWLVRRLLKNQ